MSALSARDANAQAMSNPFETKSKTTAGEENIPESQQHKQVLDNKATENAKYVFRRKGWIARAFAQQTG